MQEIAKQMANAYCESVSWIDLRIIAEHVLEGQVKQEAGSNLRLFFCAALSGLRGMI